MTYHVALNRLKIVWLSDVKHNQRKKILTPYIWKIVLTSSLPRARFHQLGATHKLQKAWPFFINFARMSSIYKTTQLFWHFCLASSWWNWTSIGVTEWDFYVANFQSSERTNFRYLHVRNFSEISRMCRFYFCLYLNWQTKINCVWRTIF